MQSFATSNEHPAGQDELASLCHELRTPLNAIIGFASLLSDAERSNLGDRERRFVQNIAEAADRMANLVEEIADLRRARHEPRPVRLEPLPVRDSVDAAVALAEPFFIRGRHRLEVDIDDDAARVLAEPRPLLQILANLLSNAARFTEPHGRVVVRARRRETQVLLEVEDSGIGMDAEDVPHVFDYYARPGAKHRHHMKGPGVGLALTRALVERLGGSIAVESEPGRGSTFRVALGAG